MNTPRIIRDNRRERGRPLPDATEWVLRIAASLLTLIGAFRRYREPRKAQTRPARVSDVQEDLYAEWLMIEHSVATGQTTRESVDRYWRRRAE